MAKRRDTSGNITKKGLTNTEKRRYTSGNHYKPAFNVFFAAQIFDPHIYHSKAFWLRVSRLEIKRIIIS
jgi:hypothetical protein